MPDVQLQSGESLHTYQHQHSPYSQAARQDRKRKKKEKTLWILQSELFTFSIIANWLYAVKTLHYWEVNNVCIVSVTNTWSGDIERVGQQAHEVKVGHAVRGAAFTLFRRFFRRFCFFFLWEKKQNKTQQFHHKVCNCSTCLLKAAFFFFFFFYSWCLISAKHHQFILVLIHNKLSRLCYFATGGHAHLCGPLSRALRHSCVETETGIANFWHILSMESAKALVPFRRPTALAAVDIESGSLTTKVSSLCIKLDYTWCLQNNQLEKNHCAGFLYLSGLFLSFI